MKSKQTILVVDDTPENISVVKGVLGAIYKVKAVLNGETALKVAGADTPDLILLDVMMPEMDGYEVCEKLKQSDSLKDVPVIFLTAKNQAEDIVKGFEVGAIDYINKPFNPQELKARVNTHLQLKAVQTQLVQSEKMAGLGTLVAGVAHEINNPVNFVHMNTQNLKSDIQKHKDFLYELLEEEKEIIAHLDSSFQKFDSKLKDINEGSERIKTIVLDLRTFSRLDEAEQKTIPLSEGIDSTLRLVKAKYKKDVEFICSYQDDPNIECWPAQLNQVFMNIIINASQAIISKQVSTGDPTPGTLTIQTLLHGNELGISFHDTGCGMTNDVKQKIFEPFFTTKPVGEGTGMGMAITYGIIEQHKGRLEIDSVLDEGTKITVFLPVSDTQ
jgi:two-component system, NtrC family, sensor kinase